MGKTIQLTRSELVWQTRCNSWDESDYQKYLDWLKGFENKKDQGQWYRDNFALYNFLSAYKWDEICRYFDEYDEDEPVFVYYDENGEKRYSSSITDIIQDAMREDNYDCDICSEDYADDSDERWEVITSDDDEDEE